jgi:hypothetical protein
VTVADLVVVVGVVVVVVVVLVLADGEDAVRAVLVAVEDEEPVCEVAVAALVPACSFATRSPMRAVDAVAATTADCVIRRRR